MKNISFLSENFQFLEVKFSIYLKRRGFVTIGEKEQRDSRGKEREKQRRKMINVNE